VNGQRSTAYLDGLLHELRALPHETEWLEFKESYGDPQEIGEYISALANSAALVGKAAAYLVWGVRDSDHAIVGTSFDPTVAKKGNEALESWLLRLLEPKIDEPARACYLHACLKYVTRDFLTNTSLRERFGIRTNNKAMVSRYIREAVAAGAIRPFDEHAPPKLRKYVPFWAGVPDDR
jgi:hypothetical protein